jgi:hypothetical protein
VAASTLVQGPTGWSQQAAASRAVWYRLVPERLDALRTALAA